MFTACVWSIKYRRKEKLIAQFGGKLRDERFEPNQSMFEHYLPNKNKRAVALKSKFLQLNQGLFKDQNGG